MEPTRDGSGTHHGQRQRLLHPSVPLPTPQSGSVLPVSPLSPNLLLAWTRCVGSAASPGRKQRSKKPEARGERSPWSGVLGNQCLWGRFLTSGRARKTDETVEWEDSSRQHLEGAELCLLASFTSSPDSSNNSSSNNSSQRAVCRA